MRRTNPFLFQKDGSLDLSQVFLAVLVLWVVIAFTLNGLGVLTFTPAAYAFWGSFLSLAFLAWAARDRAAVVAKSRTPGDVAKGIASAGGDAWRDDERGAHPERDYL